MRQQTGREKYNNEVFMVWAGAGRHGLTDTDWIYLKFSKVSLSLQTEFIISRQSELTDMKDNEAKIDCALMLTTSTSLLTSHAGQRVNMSTARDGDSLCDQL